MSAHVPIPQLGDTPLSCEGYLECLHECGIDEGLSDVRLPLGNDLSPQVRSLRDLNHSRDVQIVPSRNSLAMNEQCAVPSTAIVFPTRPHASGMLAPLCGRKVGTWAKMLVAGAVVNARCGGTLAHSASLDAPGLGDEDAGVELAPVNATQCFCVGIDEVGALVAGGGCCGTLVRRHDG